jgi:dCTP deaminase
LRRLSTINFCCRQKPVINFLYISITIMDLKQSKSKVVEMGEAVTRLHRRFSHLSKIELDDVVDQLRAHYQPSELVKKLGIDGLISGHSTLSDKAILRHKKSGTVIIEPFDKRHLSTSSYDVTLGMNYFREKKPQGSSPILNTYDEEKVRGIWELSRAKTLEQEMDERRLSRKDIGKNIKLKDYVIMLHPQETILGHTNEFIGGKDIVTTMMKARSSLGRNFIEVCKCAGWGDVGYTNRWTMEITNNSQYHIIPLVVGRRIGQIVFFETGPILKKDYVQTGKYQSESDLKQIRKLWTPDAMIPKMWKDWEVKQ